MISEIFSGVHFITLAALIVTIVTVDYKAHAWFVGKVKLMSRDFVKKSHLIVVIGLYGMIVSGVTILATTSEDTHLDYAFFIKMGFVLALFINAFVIKKYMYIATEKTIVEVDKKTKKILFVSGAVSTISWAGAIICALIWGGL